MTKVGIGLPGQSIADVRESAEAAVAYSFDSFSVYGDLGDLPPYAVLHATANVLQGSDIGHIGPMGVPVGLQHPEITARHAEALAEQLPGQTFVGLVRGAFLEQIDQRPASLANLEQVVLHVREVTGQEGHKLPIYLGGFGPKILLLAGELGVQAVKLGGSTNPSLAERAQLLIGNPEVKIILGAVSVIDSDRQAARARARSEVAKYLAVVGELDPTLNEDERASLDAFNRRFALGDPMAENSISDSLLDKFALAGTPEDALETLERMGNMVERFEFGTPHGLGRRTDAISLIGESILKQLGE